MEVLQLFNQVEELEQLQEGEEFQVGMETLSEDNITLIDGDQEEILEISGGLISMTQMSISQIVTGPGLVMFIIGITLTGDSINGTGEMQSVMKRQDWLVELWGKQEESEEEIPISCLMMLEDHSWDSEEVEHLEGELEGLLLPLPLQVDQTTEEKQEEP